MVHSLKSNPITKIQDPNRFFDFWRWMETCPLICWLKYVYWELSIPKPYSFMDGNGVHAYKMENKNGQFKYVKFPYFTKQGDRNLTMSQATKIHGMKFNRATRNL